MADKTVSTESLSRDAAADRFNDIASALREGEDFTVRVGNKDVSLHPSDSVNYHIEVVEKRKRLRRNREKIVIELDWTPSE